MDFLLLQCFMCFFLFHYVITYKRACICCCCSSHCSLNCVLNISQSLGFWTGINNLTYHRSIPKFQLFSFLDFLWNFLNQSKESIVEIVQAQNCWILWKAFLDKVVQYYASITGFSLIFVYSLCSNKALLCDYILMLSKNWFLFSKYWFIQKLISNQIKIVFF